MGRYREYRSTCAVRELNVLTQPQLQRFAYESGIKNLEIVEKENFAANSKFIDMAGKASIGLSKQWGVSKLSYSFLNQKIGIIDLQLRNDDKFYRYQQTGRRFCNERL